MNDNNTTAPQRQSEPLNENEYRDAGKRDRRNEEHFDSYKDKALDETDRLGFAKWILFFLFILVIFVFGSSYDFAIHHLEETDRLAVVNTILDFTKTAVPSIVSLVLGFYFGKKD